VKITSIPISHVNSIMPCTSSRIRLLGSGVHICDKGLNSRRAQSHRHEDGAVDATPPDSLIRVVSNATKSGRQAKGTVSTKSGCAKQAPGKGQRRDVSKERILRPKRHSPGPLRNAKKTSYGRIVCKRGSKQIRNKPPSILSNTREVRRSRIGRPDTRKAGSEETSKVHGGDSGFCQKTTYMETGTDLGRPDARDRGKVRSQTTSEDYTTGSCKTEKKTSAQEKTIVASTKDSDRMVEMYEQLRESVLQTDATQVHVPGLGVFVLRGFMGWIKALSVHEQTLKRDPERTGIDSKSVIHHKNPELVHILANMVLSCCEVNP